MKGGPFNIRSWRPQRSAVGWRLSWPILWGYNKGTKQTRVPRAPSRQRVKQLDKWWLCRNGEMETSGSRGGCTSFRRPRGRGSRKGGRVAERSKTTLSHKQSSREPGSKHSQPTQCPETELLRVHQEIAQGTRILRAKFSPSVAHFPASRPSFKKHCTPVTSFIWGWPEI